MKMLEAELDESCFQGFEGTGFEIFRHAIYAKKRTLVKNAYIILGVGGIIALIMIAGIIALIVILLAVFVGVISFLVFFIAR